MVGYTEVFKCIGNIFFTWLDNGNREIIIHFLPFCLLTILKWYVSSFKMSIKVGASEQSLAMFWLWCGRALGETKQPSRAMWWSCTSLMSHDSPEFCSFVSTGNMFGSTYKTFPENSKHITSIYEGACRRQDILCE